VIKYRHGGESGRAAAWAWRAAAIALAALVAFFLVRGCAFMPWNSGGRTSLRITVCRDFGREVIRDVRLELKKQPSAMRALQEVAEVETAYGGGFIQAVDGLASKYEGGAQEKVDWFFYVNGQMADVGADAYRVQEGDWLIFDYHSWEYSTFTPFLAACFPEPFLHGYGGPPAASTVIYAPGRESEAGEIAHALQLAGAAPCRLEALTENWEPQPGEYAALVGTFEELEKNTMVREANLHPERLGLFAFFRDGELVITDAQGREARRLSSGAGLVEGLGPRLGDGACALMVSGVDEEGLREALAVLAERRDAAPTPAIVVLAGQGTLDVPAR